VAIATPVALSADTISTFSLTGVLTGGTASGTVTIDITTGLFQAANVTVLGTLGSGVVSSGTLVFSGTPFDQQFDSFNSFYFAGFGLNGATPSFPTQPYGLAIEIASPSAVGYTGGSISTSDVAMLASSNSSFDDIFTSGSLTFVSSVTTPEPASFLLLGVGVLALAAVRRRAVAS
jgi:hypothetical protein